MLIYARSRWQRMCAWNQQQQQQQLHSFQASVRPVVVRWCTLLARMINRVCLKNFPTHGVNSHSIEAHIRRAQGVLFARAKQCFGRRCRK